MKIQYIPCLPGSGYTSNLYFVYDRNGKFLASIIEPLQKIICEPRYQHDLPRMLKIAREMNFDSAIVQSQHGQVILKD